MCSSEKSDLHTSEIIVIANVKRNHGTKINTHRVSFDSKHFAEDFFSAVVFTCFDETTGKSQKETKERCNKFLNLHFSPQFREFFFRFLSAVSPTSTLESHSFAYFVRVDESSRDKVSF